MTVTLRTAALVLVILVSIFLLTGCDQFFVEQPEVLPEPDVIYIWPPGKAYKPDAAGFPEIVEAVNSRIPNQVLTVKVGLEPIIADGWKKDETVVEFAYKSIHEVKFRDQNGTMLKRFTNVLIPLTPLDKSTSQLIFFADNTGVLPATTLDYERFAIGNLAEAKELLRVVKDTRAGKIKKREPDTTLGIPVGQ